jgi:hypothetical protein
MIVICQLVERLHQERPGNTELFQTLFHRLRQDLLALFSQFHQDVRADTPASDQIICLGPIHKLDRAVVPGPELMGQRTDGPRNVIRKASYRKEQLILPWFDPRSPGGLIAEIQVAAHVVSKFGERAVIGFLGGPFMPVCFGCHHFERYRDTILSFLQII